MSLGGYVSSHAQRIREKRSAEISRNKKNVRTENNNQGMHKFAIQPIGSIFGLTIKNGMVSSQSNEARIAKKKAAKEALSSRVASTKEGLRSQRQSMPPTTIDCTYGKANSNAPIQLRSNCTWQDGCLHCR